MLQRCTRNKTAEKSHESEEERRIVAKQVDKHKMMVRSGDGKEEAGLV